MTMLFAAVHESGCGTKRTYRSISTFVCFQLKADRTSGKIGQRLRTPGPG
jgi:hypothetical protein